jgi:hypothetical protein
LGVQKFRFFRGKDGWIWLEIGKAVEDGSERLKIVNCFYGLAQPGLNFLHVERMGELRFLANLGFDTKNKV